VSQVKGGEEWRGLNLGQGAAPSSDSSSERAAELAGELTAAMAKGTEERRAAAGALLDHLRTGDASARLAARQAGTLEAAVVMLRTELNSGGPGTYCRTRSVLF
jgi:hypothetical protein